MEDYLEKYSPADLEVLKRIISIEANSRRKGDQEKYIQSKEILKALNKALDRKVEALRDVFILSEKQNK